MNVTTIRPADPAAMERLRRKWEGELESMRRDLDAALREAARITADGVRVAHHIDDLRERIDQRAANLAKYRP